MTKQFTMPLHTPWFKGPLNYKDSDMIQVIFTPTAETFERILPKPLKPGLLGGAYVANFKSVQFGDFWESALVFQCTYKEHFGLYTLAMFIDNDASTVAHRELWGYPAKMGKIKYTRKDNRFKAIVSRGKDTLMKFDVNVEGPGEFIDTGASINVKLIPSADGKGYDVKQITATGIQITVNDGLAGDGKLTLYNTDEDPLADLVQLESVVAGMWFNINMHVPFGEVIGEVEL